MKKTLTPLAGIVFLISILIAGGCKASGAGASEDMDKIEINCKAVDVKGEMHFIIYDLNDTVEVIVNHTKDNVVANLTTYVKPKTKVIWTWVPDSEIDEFLKIKPKKYGDIIDKDPEKISGTQKFKLTIPKNAPVPSPEEKYEILFLNLDGDTITIDPYLRIR